MKRTHLMIGLLMTGMFFTAMLSTASNTTTTPMAESKDADGGVPKAVKDALMKAHPDATNVKWEKEGKEYEAEFKHNGKEMSVKLDASGKILETEMEIGNAEIPQGAKDYLANTFPDYELEEAERVDAMGVISYELEIEVGETNHELTFDANGNFVKDEVEHEGHGKGDHDEDEDNDFASCSAFHFQQSRCLWPDLPQ